MTNIVNIVDRFEKAYGIEKGQEEFTKSYLKLDFKYYDKPIDRYSTKYTDYLEKVLDRYLRLYVERHNENRADYINQERICGGCNFNTQCRDCYLSASDFMNLKTK